MDNSYDPTTEQSLFDDNSKGGGSSAGSMNEPGHMATPKSDVPQIGERQKSASESVLNRAAPPARGIPVMETLEQNELLKNENLQQRLEISRLRGIFPFINGKSGEKICEEFAILTEEKFEWDRKRGEYEERIKEVENENGKLLNKISSLEDYKESQGLWSKDVKERYVQLEDYVHKLEEQLSVARERYPDFDDSIDSIFGDAKDKKIGDLEDKIRLFEFDRQDAEEEMTRLRESLKSLEKQLCDANYRIEELQQPASQNEKTFSVNVGDLDKMSYDQKIIEMQQQIDERDVRMKEVELELQKSIRLIAVMEKKKYQLEQQVASLTVSHFNITMPEELRPSAIGTEERRQETMTELMGGLHHLQEENKELVRQLRELGAAYKNEVMNRSAAPADTTDQVVNDILAKLDKVCADDSIDKFNYSANNFSVSSYPDKRESSPLDSPELDSSARVIAEASFAAKQNIAEMNDRLRVLKETCRLMFERLQASSEVFSEILRHVQVDRSDLLDQIKTLHLEFNDSSLQWKETNKVFEELETSVNEVSFILEQSLNESQMALNLSVLHATRLAGGASQADLNKSLQKLLASPSQLAVRSPKGVPSPRFVNKQIFDQERVKFEKLEAEWLTEKSQLEKTRDDLTLKLSQVSTDLAAAELQVEKTQQILRETECAFTEYKQKSALLDSEQRARCGELERLHQELQEQKTMVDELQNNLEAERVLIVKVREINMALKEECEKLVSENGNVADMQGKMEKLEKKKEELESRFAGVVEREERLLADVADLTLREKQARESAVTHEANAKRFVGELEAMEERLHAAESQAANDRQQCQNMEQKLTELMRSQFETQKDSVGNFAHRSSQTLDQQHIPMTQITSIENEALRLADRMGDLARLRGDKSDKDYENDQLLSECDPIERVLRLLTTLGGSVDRACTWTKAQLDEIEHNNRRLKEVLAAKPVETAKQTTNTHDANEVSLRVEEAEHPLAEQENKPASDIKFKDPLRQEFFEMAKRADEVVQEIKKLAKSNAGQLEKYERVIVLARDLRTMVSQKYNALNKTPKEKLTYSDILDRMLVLTEERNALATKLIETRQLLKETKEQVVSGQQGGNRCLLDGVLASTIEKEMVAIKGVLSQCSAGSRDKRVVLKSTDSGNCAGES